MANDQPLRVSVVIPVFNGAESLPDVVEEFAHTTPSLSQRRKGASSQSQKSYSSGIEGPMPARKHYGTSMNAIVSCGQSGFPVTSASMPRPWQE